MRNYEVTPPGGYDVTVQPQPHGSPPVVLSKRFTMLVPEIEFVDPASGTMNDEVTVYSLFFGTKRGIVAIGGKNCRVKSWILDPLSGEGQIKTVVPRGLSPGIHELKVTNGVGSDSVNFTID